MKLRSLNTGCNLTTKRKYTVMMLPELTHSYKQTTQQCWSFKQKTGFILCYKHALYLWL